MAAVIALESMGIPLPGEATLIAASAYAGSTHRLDISLILLAGVCGAILGDNFGYWIGRRAGFALLVRYGGMFGMTDARLRSGRYLFFRHGGKVVFVGRFFAFLRMWAAVFAGAFGMGWRGFMAFNAASAVLWVCTYGLGAYVFGARIGHAEGPWRVASLAAAAVVLVAGFLVLRRREAQLQVLADAHCGGGPHEGPRRRR